MSKLKHTPGPYTVSGNSIVAGDICIAVIEDDGGYEAPAEQREANARLLAASPEMFHELKEVLEWADRSNAESKENSRWPELHAIIERVEGEVGK